jgi:hypothetical protein
MRTIWRWRRMKAADMSRNITVPSRSIAALPWFRVHRFRFKVYVLGFRVHYGRGGYCQPRHRCHPSLNPRDEDAICLSIAKWRGMGLEDIARHVASYHTMPVN